MPSVQLGGHTVRLTADKLIGKGGEADIYKLDEQTVLKLYKKPGDPDYSGNPSAQQGAAMRIAEQQRKLPLFPHSLPPEVVAPLELAYDGAGIAGFSMPYVQGAEVLMRLADRQYRDSSGIDGNEVVSTFRQLHATLGSIHRAGAVVGDFNDLNVLFSGALIKVVDADSMGFGGFDCHTFTSRFVDPLNCESGRLVLSRPHTPESDWYAYFVMLLQSLLYVGPYGGVHRPKGGKRLQHDDRVLSRLTVLDHDVIYPKPALPFTVLPDELLDRFERVFSHDERGEFPLQLLDTLRWTTCLNCGLTHARRTCPSCTIQAPAPLPALIVRGIVTAKRVFHTEGRLLQVTTKDGTLRYLFHENGSFYRENGELLKGDVGAELRFRIMGSATVLGSGNSLFLLDKGRSERFTTDTYRHALPVFDATSRHAYWLSGNQLVHDGQYGPEYIGDIVPNQTLFWTGERLGFGFYQAGQLVRGFVFDPTKRGMNDGVELDALPGQLTDATCVFGHDRIWFMVSSQDQGVLQNRCFVFDGHGTRLADLSVPSGDDSWLGSGIKGHLAIGRSLYVSTDDGIVRLSTQGGSIVVERRFPDTEPFVTALTTLIEGHEGIYAVSNQEIVLLKIA